MAESGVAKSRCGGKIVITDGGALSYEVTLEDGSFTYSKPPRESTTIMDRCAIAGRLQGNEQVGSWSFSCHMRSFTDASNANIMDVLHQTGTWAGATSTGTTGFEGWLFDITYTSEGTEFGDSADHSVKLNMCALTSVDFSEGDPNQFSISGEFFGAATRTGPA